MGGVIHLNSGRSAFELMPSSRGIQSGAPLKQRMNAVKMWTANAVAHQLPKHRLALERALTARLNEFGAGFLLLITGMSNAVTGSFTVWQMRLIPS